MYGIRFSKSDMELFKRLPIADQYKEEFLKKLAEAEKAKAEKEKKEKDKEPEK